MVNAEDILKSMQEQMQEYSKQFDEINAQIEQMQVEYEKNIQAALSRREQIRGQYTSIYNTYMKFKEQPESAEKQAEVVNITDAQKGKLKNSKSVKKEESNNKVLSEEELAKLQKAINKPKDVNEADIPDYLKDEYNK